jgi:glycosyltransferase involved in cell wall biosynthesis
MVLPISQHAAQEVRAWWSARAERAVKAEVVACPLAAEFPGAERVVPAAPGADQEIHIISVGPLDRRKNQQTLIRAIERAAEAVKGRRISLTLLGAGQPLGVQASAHRNVRIQALGPIPDERLISLYKECTFTVFPSLDEGFGLPIAESLWFGKPCICAGFGAMGELARGGGCLTVDPRDPEQLSTAITRLIAEPELRHRLAKEASTRALPRWSDYAGSVLDCLGQRP